MHLGAPYMGDVHENERRLVRFLERIRHDAKAIYLLGDVLDYWYEYQYCVPRGYVRFFGELASLADSGIKIKWFIGNHDIWIFDYLPSELGVEVIDGPVVEIMEGKKFLLAHGDGLGQTPRMFRFIRAMFRNKICQKLYSGIHPRWTIPFAYAWSRHSRENGEEPLQDTHPLLESLREYSLQRLKEDKDMDFFIYGHLHILCDIKLNEKSRMIVLGDWLHRRSYGVFDGESFLLKEYEE